MVINQLKVFCTCHCVFAQNISLLVNDVIIFIDIIYAWLNYIIILILVYFACIAAINNFYLYFYLFLSILLFLCSISVLPVRSSRYLNSHTSTFRHRWSSLASGLFDNVTKSRRIARTTYVSNLFRRMKWRMIQYTCWFWKRVEVAGGVKAGTGALWWLSSLVAHLQWWR